MTRAEIIKAIAEGTDLSSANLRAADLRAADLSSADLRYADLRAADLRAADLRYANLRYADLSSANLRAADLRYADLSSANLRAADLRAADGVIRISGTMHEVFATSKGIWVGCISLDYKNWRDQYEEAGKENGYSAEQIKEYLLYLELCAARFAK